MNPQRDSTRDDIDAPVDRELTAEELTVVVGGLDLGWWQDLAPRPDPQTGF